MRLTMLALFLIFAGTSAFATAAGQDQKAHASGPQVTTILKTDVAGVEDKEREVITLELAPGAVNARHFYSGVELIYVLEGAGFLEMDGKLPVAMNAGTVTALHQKQIHVLKNTSQTQTLRVVVVLLREKGQPRLVLANRGTSPKAVEQNKSTVPGLVF
jgi:quercetin dioxygenase-like cupin family protein